MVGGWAVALDGFFRRRCFVTSAKKRYTTRTRISRVALHNNGAHLPPELPPVVVFFSFFFFGYCFILFVVVAAVIVVAVIL